MKYYIRLAKKWLWLVILAAVIAGGSFYFMISDEPITFTAKTKVFIGGYRYLDNPDYSAVRIAFELTLLYAELAKTTDVLQDVIDELDLPISATALRSMVDVSTLGDTPSFELSVISDNAEDAANIANSVAQQLILRSPTNLTPALQSALDLANFEIDRLSQQLQDDRSQLEEINRELQTTTTSDERLILENRKDTLVQRINEASANVDAHLTTKTNLEGRANSLEIIEPARVPKRSNPRNILNRVAIATMAGAGLAIGIILGLEYLNTSIKDSQEAAQLLGLPVLGTIARFGDRKSGYADRLLLKQTESIVLEGYRTLQANLLFAAGEELKGMYIITSPNEGEGKSITVANLAVSMALAGLKVLLVDADLQKPRIHEFFELDNSVGLATLLSSTPSDTNLNQSLKLNNGHQATPPDELLRYIQRTQIPNLSVLTSGTADGNLTAKSGGLFLLYRFKEWIHVLLQTDVDVVLFDTPPSLVSVDSTILAATTEADIILVIQAGRTKRDEALRAKGQFLHINRDIRGVVLNKTNRRDVDHGYGYGYYDELATLKVRPQELRREAEGEFSTRPVQPLPQAGE